MATRDKRSGATAKRRAPTLKTAASYAEWRKAALAEDERSGAAAWRHDDRSRRYDYKVIRRRHDELRALRKSGDPHALLFYLNEGIHGNMGGMGRKSLYGRARFGTKDLITNYIGELAAAIEQLATVDDATISLHEKRDFFRRASHCFGRSALMLSGAGALGPIHLGVAKALLEQDLLPDVISGASAGSMVAAFLGTHTDAELHRLFANDILMQIPRSSDDTGPRRLELEDVRAVIAAMVPDITFAEAFEISGRHINVPVSPAELHQSSRLLNATTSPNVFIREAVLASSSVPGILPPVTLMAKNRAGQRQPYVPSRRWVDGSISDDLPARRIGRLYGVNHFITSQVNPLAMFTVRDTEVQDSLLMRLVDIYQGAAREMLRASWPVTMRFIKDTYPLNVYARMAFSVAVQDYTADINIIPRRRLWGPFKLLSILSSEETRELIQDGERATWPKIAMIRNCSLVGRTLDRLRRDIEERVERGNVSVPRRLRRSA